MLRPQYSITFLSPTLLRMGVPSRQQARANLTGRMHAPSEQVAPVCLNVSLRVPVPCRFLAHPVRTRLRHVHAHTCSTRKRGHEHASHKVNAYALKRDQPHFVSRRLHPHGPLPAACPPSSICSPRQLHDNTFKAPARIATHLTSIHARIKCTCT